MALAIYNFHRVLIVAATLFFISLAVYAFLRQQSAPDGSNMAMMIGSAAAAVVGMAYFIYFNAKLRRRRMTGPMP